jgi:hypothetical protein
LLYTSLVDIYQQDLYIATAKIGLEKAAYYMTLQQIVNDLPSVKEICNIHRDDLKSKIDALLR